MNRKQAIANNYAAFTKAREAMNEQATTQKDLRQTTPVADGSKAEAGIQKEESKNLPTKYGSQSSKALTTAKDRPEWFSSVVFFTRNERLELMRLEGRREADHEKFKSNGQAISHLVRIPYEYVDKKTAEEITIPRYLCLNTDGVWLNVFSDGMVRAIDKLVNAFGIPPWEKPFRFILEEIDVGKPSPFLSLRFQDA